MNKKILIIFVGILFYWFWSKNKDRNVSVKHLDKDFEFTYLEKENKIDGKSDSLPLIIALHGNGDNPNNFYNLLFKNSDIKARFILIKAPFAYGNGSSWPIKDELIRLYGEALDKTITHVSQNFDFPGRPIVFGFSGGAIMTYYLAANKPHNYSFLIPVAGKLSKALFPSGLYQEPKGKVYAFHGSEDKLFRYTYGEKACENLKKLHVEVEFSLFKGPHLGVFLSNKSEVLMKLKELTESL